MTEIASPVCHPYEPGFLACVGGSPSPSWNPYGPSDLALIEARFGAGPEAQALHTPGPIALQRAMLDLPTAGPTGDDEIELSLSRAFEDTALSTPVAEPALFLLAVLGVACCLRRRVR